MRLRQILAFVTFCLVTVLVLVGAYFYLESQKKLVIESKSVFYDVTVRDTSVLEHYLSAWKILESNTIVASKTPGDHTIRRVVIQLADEEQDTVIISDQGPPAVVQMSSSSYIAEPATLLVKLYINPSYATGTPIEEVTKNALLLTFKELYAATHGGAMANIPGQNQSDSLVNAVTVMYEQPEVRPFVIVMRE